MEATAMTLHDDRGPIWLVLERLTVPDIGHRHAALVDAGSVIAFDDRHWSVIAQGPLSDTAALAAACAASGIEVPTNPVSP